MKEKRLEWKNNYNLPEEECTCGENAYEFMYVGG